MLKLGRKKGEEINFGPVLISEGVLKPLPQGPAASAIKEVYTTAAWMNYDKSEGGRTFSDSTENLVVEIRMQAVVEVSSEVA